MTVKNTKNSIIILSSFFIICCGTDSRKDMLTTDRRSNEDSGEIITDKGNNLNKINLRINLNDEVDEDTKLQVYDNDNRDTENGGFYNIWHKSNDGFEVKFSSSKESTAEVKRGAEEKTYSDIDVRYHPGWTIDEIIDKYKFDEEVKYLNLIINESNFEESIVYIGPSLKKGFVESLESCNSVMSYACTAVNHVIGTIALFVYNPLYGLPQVACCFCCTWIGFKCRNDENNYSKALFSIKGNTYLQCGAYCCYCCTIPCCLYYNKRGWNETFSCCRRCCCKEESKITAKCNQKYCGMKMI